MFTGVGTSSLSIEFVLMNVIPVHVINPLVNPVTGVFSKFILLIFLKKIPRR